MPASGLTMAQVAHELAVAVGAQWEAEVAVRRLNDPYPLPVSWAAADASLTDPWDSLVKLAVNGAGWPPPPPAGTWAAGPDELAGEGGELAKVLARVPTGRLVVLGEPGAGKSILMVRLVLDLLDRRTEGGPVPFLVSIASWEPKDQESPEPKGQDLWDWLGAQLRISHSALADPPPAGRTEGDQAAALLAEGLILPILDGLDEIPEHVLGRAISGINDVLRRPAEQVVVTCRTQQYRDAVRPAGGVEVSLRAAAAVQLRPLDADAVRGYLCDDAAGPVAKARWDPVLAVLGTDAPAGQALATPLMVGLARAIYNPLPGEAAGTLRDPVELCRPALTDRTAVEFLLFDEFIPAAYRHDPAGRWEVQDAERWLVFLARHLERRIWGPDLAWWQLPQAVPGLVDAVKVSAVAVVGFAVGGVFGAVAGVGVVFGVVAGIVGGVIFGAGTLDGAVSRSSPVREIRLWLARRSNWLRRRSNIMAGVAAIFVAVSSAARIVLLNWATEPSGVPLDLSSAADPLAVLIRDRRKGIVVGLVRGITYGAVAGVAVGLAAGPAAGAVDGAVVAIAFGLVGSFALTKWPSYGLARIWLALRRRLPWPLMDFLADAHRRGVLRQTGAVYQFRHIELQRRLAKRDTGKHQTNSPFDEFRP